MEENRERFEQRMRVVERAERMGIVDWREARFNRVMDLDFADRQFDLRLDLMLEAPDEDFAHDWIGIHTHINRETCKVEDCFVPRYAGCYHSKSSPDWNSVINFM